MNKSNLKINYLSRESPITTTQKIEQQKQQRKILDRNRLTTALKIISKAQVIQHQKKYPNATKLDAVAFFNLPSQKTLDQLTTSYNIKSYPKKKANSVKSKSRNKKKLKVANNIKSHLIGSSAPSPIEDVNYSSWQNGKFENNGTKAIYSRRGIDKPEDHEKKQKLNTIIGKPITIEGYRAFEEELSLLKNNGFKHIKQLFEAAETSFEKREARLESEKITTRINNLETLLSVSTIVNHKTINNKHKIMVGHKVTVLDITDNIRYCYLLGGPTESNIEMNTISSNSPIGEALLGKKLNQKIRYDSPDGVIQMLITKIE
ncbi:GreA/GreB family elongation factor [Enterococcus sp.]|uniref:GreA/GreB family elongation factor n=1 Tax=Enterococcus sp. TaxID=35783 RepID=UPI002FC6E8DF